MDTVPTESLAAAIATPAGARVPSDLTAAMTRVLLGQWVVLFITLLLIGGFIAKNLYEQRQSILSVAQNRLSLSAKSLVLHVERRLSSIDTTLLDLRKSLPSLRAENDNKNHVLIHLRILQNTLGGLNTIDVLDAQGRITASSQNELIGENFSQSGFFQAALHKPEQQTLYVSEPFKTTLGTYSLNLAHATFDKSGKFSGIVAATLDPEDLKPMFASLRYSPDVSIGLVHGSGKVLLALSAPEIEPDTDVSATGTTFSRHIQSGQKFSQFIGKSTVLSNERLVAAQTINPTALSMSTPLVVIVSQETAAILEPWHAHVLSQSLLFTLLAAISVFGQLFHQRHQLALASQNIHHQSERQRDLDRLTLATEASGTGIWELDLKSNAMAWDDTMFRLYGKERDHALSTYTTWQQSVLPEDWPEVEADLQRSIKQHKEFDTLFRIQRSDGEIRIIDARAWVYSDASGEATRMVGVNRDITQRQKIEQALRDSKEFIASILDSLIQHVAVLDSCGVILMVNQAWRDFSHHNGGTGRTLESIGLNYLDICSSAPAFDYGEEAAAVLIGIREVLAGAVSEFIQEYSCHSPTENRWFIMHVTPLRGPVSGAVVAHENITTRKLAERAVRKSEERFSAFFEHAMVGMATTSLEKGWMLVNPALCAILGYQRDELIRKTWAELTHPDDLAADVANFECLLRDEADHYAMEKRFIQPNGAIVHAFIAVRAVRRSDRSIEFFAAIVEDITERKLAEEAILRVQRVTQQFIDHLPGTAYVKDENLRVLMANKTFQNVLGMDVDSMIGKTNSELFPSYFASKLDADDRQILAAGGSTVIEEDFEGRFFETIKFVIESDSGKHWLGGITMEVTQRQKFIERQQAMLKISELGGTLPEIEFLRQGLEMIERLTGSSIGFIHFVNDDQESIELVAWTTGALKGCTAVHEKHYPLGKAGIWADCARRKETSVFNDYPAYCAKKGLPEGHAPLSRLISVPVIEENKVRMILGVGNKAVNYDDYDCTTAHLIGNDLWRIIRRMRAEAVLKEKLAELITLNARLDETNNKLLQSEKLASIGQLAAGVAHEINNPIAYVTSNLNSLSGYVSDLLSIDAAYNEIDEHFGNSMPHAFQHVQQLKAETDHDFIVSDIRHLLKESSEGLERVRKIVQDLKDFSRIGGTGWQWINLHEGLESTLNIAWNEIKYKAEVDRDYGNLPEIHCIPSQINQVFLNLLTNAAQSIATHGHIMLRSGCDADTVWLEVQDDGAGIAPEHLEHLFEPFFTTKPVGQGTGLGLSLSWSIVQRHHGKIEVRSVLGQGTTFRIILPIDPHPELDSKPHIENAS